MVQFNDIAALILNLLPTGQQITAANHRTVETAILTFAKEQWLPGDIKMIDCTSAYIAANFVAGGSTIGLGLPGGEREGWAICNGYNGTKNRKGRVSVGYDGVNTVFASGLPNDIGETGGTEKHTLSVTEMPRHRHDALLYSEGGSGYFAGGAGGSAGGDGTGLTRYTGGAGSGETNNLTTGTAVAHNNMQPYIVTLFIQKL